MATKKSVDDLATMFLSGGSAGTITAALITEGGTLMVGLTAASVATAIYARGKIRDRQIKRTRAQKLKDEKFTGRVNIRNVFNGTAVDHNFIIAIYKYDNNASFSVVGHKDPKVAIQLQKEQVLLPLDKIFECADYREVRFVSF